LAGGALGGFVGGPLGAKIGSGLASAAGNALGLEAEMMSGEDREFEGAKQFVRLAADAASRAASAPGGDPRAIAQQATIAATKKFALGLLSGRAGKIQMNGGQMQGGSSSAPMRGKSGLWMRQGRKIILYGV
jgi:hypothetical protein